MILQTANGPKEIKVAELDFTNLMCDLEDHDVDVMGLLDDDTRENMKIFKTIRAIIAVLTGTKDLTTAGKILSEHLKYGGSMDEVMGAFTEAMKTAVLARKPRKLRRTAERKPRRQQSRGNRSQQIQIVY